MYQNIDLNFKKNLYLQARNDEKKIGPLKYTYFRTNFLKHHKTLEDFDVVKHNY